MDRNVCKLCKGSFEDIAKLKALQNRKRPRRKIHSPYNNVKEGKVFKREQTGLICLIAVIIHEGEEAPDMCPVCVHPKAHFQLRVIDY